MKKYRIHTVCDCYTAYIVEAESEKEAQEKFEDGYFSDKLGEDYANEQVNEIEKYFHYLYSIGYHQGARQTSHGNEVYEVDSNGNVLNRFLSTFEAEMKLGVSKGSIGKAIKENRKCKGKIFSYGNSNMAKD